jgi:hypothetical protein
MIKKKKFIDDERKTMEGKEPQRLKTPAKKKWRLPSYLKPSHSLPFLTK